MKTIRKAKWAITVNGKEYRSEKPATLSDVLAHIGDILDASERESRQYIITLRPPSGWTPSRSSIHDWPYPELDNAWKALDLRWHEVDEAIYNDQLEALPPARMSNGAFAVGEPWDHDDTGAIHAVYMKVSGRYWARNDHLSKFNPLTYKSEIKEQIERKK